MTTSTYRSHSLPMIRPAWTPATIALMVGGFIVFAPAGLAMLAYIMAGVSRTGDDESWLNAVALAAQLNSDLVRPLLEYLRVLRGEEFVRYLTESSQRQSNEAAQQFMNELATLLSSDLPEETPTEIRVHNKDGWESVKIGKG